MDVAFSKYGGISEQVYCNSHPQEQEALLRWVIIMCLTPQQTDYVESWELFWDTLYDSSEARREAFEFSYDLHRYQGIDPLTGQLEWLIKSHNNEYFDYLCEFVQEDLGDCTGLGYPAW